MAHRGAAEVVGDHVRRRLHVRKRGRGAPRFHGEQVAEDGGHAGVHHVGELDELVGHALRRAGVVLARRGGVGHLPAALLRLRVGLLHRVAEGHPHLRVERVVVAVAAQHGHLLGLPDAPLRVLNQFREPDAAEAAGEVAEERHQVLAEPDRLEQLRPAVALDGGDAHLGDHLLDGVLQRGEQVFQRLARFEFELVLRVRVLERQTVLDEPEHQVRVNRVRPEGDEAADVVPFLDVAGLHDEAALVS